MSLWNRVRSALVRDVPEPESRTLTLSDFSGLAPFLDSSISVAAGVNVSERTALNCSALWCGVNLISSQIATLPRAVYRRENDDERVRDRSVPAARVLMHPNDHMTDVVFWETLVAHALTWGGGVAEIERDNAGNPLALWPITPDRVSIRLVGPKPNERLQYWIDGGQTILEAEDVIHIPGASFNGISGYSVVQMARASIGLSIAAERFGGQFFSNGARPGIVLEHPKTLSAPAQERLKASFISENAGGRQLGVTIAEEGMTVKTYSIPPNDAQFLETRVFQVEEIARWLNISPSKLKSKIGERPGGNLEQDQINFLGDTLRPWLVRIEQELNRKLFPIQRQAIYYVEHIVDALLRTDNTTRMASYKALVDLGAMSAEQVARMENLPAPQEQLAPLPSRIESVGQLVRAGFDPEDAAKALGLPPMKHLGVLPVTVQPEEQPKPKAFGPAEKDSQRLAGAVRSVLAEQVVRFVRREMAQAKRAADKGPAEFAGWLDAFYGRGDEGRVLRAQLRPAVELVMAHQGLDGDVAEVAERLVGDYMARSKEELESLKVTDLGRELEGVSERWLVVRPMEMAEAVAALRENVNAA
jgi:HK97 family phage portal protein